MSKLSNDELQRAIDSAVHLDNSTPEKHLDALLAEQIRRLNGTEGGGGDITDNGDGTVDISAGTGVVGESEDTIHEYAVVYVNSSGGVSFSAGSMLGITLSSAVESASRMNRLPTSGSVYGVYQRRVDTIPVGDWVLLTDDLGVLPATVKHIT